MKISKEKLETVAQNIAEKLKGGQYAFRGTASLVLQGLDMGLDDIDILCDKETALNANSKLTEYLVEKVAFKESPKFKSYYGKFKINDVQVEFMGNWQIYNEKKGWSVVYDAGSDEITHITINKTEVPVTTIETELKMYAFLERWSAFHKVKRLVLESGKIHEKTTNEKQENTAQQGLF